MTRHGFHLVQLRPWPLVASIRAFSVAVGLVGWFHKGEVFLLVMGLVLLLATMLGWW